MPDYIGNVPVPEIVPSGNFPIVPEYPYGRTSHPEVAMHQFGSGNAKIEQRFLLGNGARRFLVRKAWLSELDRIALRTFWEARQGPYGAFTYNAPNDDGTGTTPVTCRFENAPLTWEMLTDHVCSVGVTLIEIPSDPPTYTVAASATRVPPTALQAALLSQTQQIVPLVRIQPLQAGYPAIYVSDRRCTVGGQLYQARLLSFDGISQGMGGESDEASFTFGNADRVMRDLANDVDLFRASLEFSLYHVESETKLDLWKGDVTNWSMDDGPEFKLSAADGLYELNLPYPTRKCSRTCGKPFDSTACPFSNVGAIDLVHFPSSNAGSCDKGYETANGCLAHGMKRYFGGILAEPQGVRIKDNSTGTWGFGRSPLTSVSMVADSIYDQVLPEIYTDSDMPVNCKIAAGRDESDFYEALGIVGEGPLAFGSGHKLDGQYHHGPGQLGLRTAAGDDPVGAADYFSLDESGNQTGGDWRKVYNGSSTFKDNFAAGTAFLVIRRSDPKGLQLSRPAEHQMEAVVATGMRGWVWTDSGDHQAFVRSAVRQVLTNPLWIAVNMLLRARGVWLSDTATQEQFFDVKALADSTLVNGQPKGAALVCDVLVDKLVGAGQERQFKFRGVMQEEKPLRDWLQEVLMNCLGFYTFSFGKLKLGVRMNSSAVEAFTEGNILFRSLRLAPIRPGFNHLSANFADEEYEFVANSITVYDKDHAAFLAGGAGPLFLKSNVNLAGTSSKSQAGRIVSVRLREELGGITPEEWKRARQVTFRTTVLALNVEPGMVCSMTHPAMPGGSGEFRVTSWRLNPDYSIDIQGRTTTDSMYDLLTGPKPADVAAETAPTEVVDPMPGDVRPFDGQPFAITQVDLPSGDKALDVVYDPPDPVSSFAGVYGVITTPDGKLHYPGDRQYNGDPEQAGVARRGSCRFVLPSPGSDEQWRVALGSLAPTFRKDFVSHDSTTGTPTPNRLIDVAAVPGGVAMPLAGAVRAVTASVKYGVFEERDGTRKLKVQVSGTVTPPAADEYFLRARLTITLGEQTLELGYSGGDHTFVADWIEIPEGNYTLRAYSVNRENAENPEYFEAADPLVIGTMPAALPITNPQFQVDEQIIEDPKTGAFKHEWRLTGSFTQEPSGYHWYVWVKLRPIAGADTRPIVPLLQVGEPERSFVSGWFPMGAETTYQVEYSGVNRLEVEGDPVVAGTFTVGPMGATGNVLAFAAGTYDEDAGAWTEAMSWDPLKQFMLIDWGCLLPSNPENWSGVAVFIKVPNASTPGGFDYVQVTGVLDKSMFTPSAAGPLTLYDRIAIELKFVPNPPQVWTFIACSYDREGNPRQDGDGKPTGPYVSLTTLAPPVKPITPDGKVNPDTLNRKLSLGDLDNANIQIEDFAGQLHIHRIANLGEFNIGSFSGNLGVNRIDNLGSFQISNFAGNLDVSRVANLNSLSIDTFQGNLDVSRVGNLASFHIGGFAGVITTQQVQDGFLADLNKFAQELRPIARVASRGAAPGLGYPDGSIVLDATDSRLYKSVGGAWQPVSASEAVSGKISASDILSVNASTINGQINAGVITHVQVSQFAGTLSAAQCQAVHIASFYGNLDITRVSNVNLIQISSLQGNLDASRVANIGSIQIGSLGGNLDVSRVANIGNLSINTFSGTIANLNVNTLTLTGQWADGHIAGIAASKIAAGTIDVTGTGMTFSGSGGITLLNGGNIYLSPGKVTAYAFEAMSALQGWTISGGMVPTISANVGTSSITASLFKHYTAGNGGTYTISIKGNDGNWHNFAFNGGILTAYQAVAQ